MKIGPEEEITGSGEKGNVRKGSEGNITIRIQE